MSASQEKRKRISDRGAELEKVTAEKAAEAKKKSLKRVRNIVIAVVVVLVIAAIFVINSNLFYTGMSAVDINGTKYTAAEANYVFRTLYSNYLNNMSATAQQYGLDASSYAGMLGLDTNKALDEQEYPFGAIGQTWADYFREQTIESLRVMTMHKDKAEAEGFTLTQEELDQIDSDVSVFDYYASLSGYSSTKQYLAAQFGKGVTMDTVRKMAQLSQLSSSYAQKVQDGFTYSDEELDAWYAENCNDYDMISFRQAIFSSSAAADAAEEEKAQAMEQAKADAETMVGMASDEESFERLAAGHEDRAADVEESGRTVAMGKNVNSSIREWLLDSARKPGDMAVLEGIDCYYAVMFLERDDNSYPMQQVRHLLVKAEADENGAYTDEAKEAAKAKAEEYLAEWKAGEATEESFAELAKAHSEDTGSAANGGLFEQVVRHAYVPEFEAFAFDPARKAGDTGIVYGESASYAGYHVMYYVGSGERYDRYIAGSELRSADMESWQSSNLESYTATTNYSFRFVK